MAIAKVILNGETLMDVTSDTATANNMLSGIKATKNDGTKVTGNIASKSSSDLTASGATVTAPAGYYANAASKAVATTTHPSPTATIASSTGVVTASHTQGTGYVTGGTTTGTLSLTTQAGKTVTPTESAQTAVASYRWTTGNVNVAAISSTYVGTGVTTRSAANLTASGSVVTAPAGYYSTAATKAVAAGSAFPPAVTITKAPTIGVNTSGVVTASYNGSSSITPTVNAGYISQGTAGTISTTGTSTYQLTSKAAATYYPSTADQTVASQRWLVGAQTFKSVTTSNLTAENIAEGVTVKVGDSSNASRITQITGTHSGATSYTAIFLNNHTGNSDIYFTYNGIKSTELGSSFTFHAGDTIVFTCPSSYVVEISENNNIIARTAPYTYTLPAYDIGIEVWGQAGGNNLMANLRITLSQIDITENGNYDVANYGYANVDVTSPYYNTYQKITWNLSAIDNTDSAYLSFTGVIHSNAFQGREFAGGTYNFTNVSIIHPYGMAGPRAFWAVPDSSIIFNFPQVITISSSAFQDRKIFSEIYCEKCTTIGSNAFMNCNLLKTISFPSCTFIGTNAFRNCYSLVSAIFPQCTQISQYAFQDCSALTTASFAKCTNMGPYTFYSCSKLTNISFPSCQQISLYAFGECSSLASAIFPSCGSIHTSAFYNCRNLSIASFPLCTSIGGSAFYNCNGLQTISFPECNTIGYSAFYNCSALTSVFLPKCYSIGQYAFALCSALSLVTISATTNPLSIGTYAFVSCYSLKEVHLSNCSLIGFSAFSRCYNLISLYLTSISSVPTLSAGVFYSTPIGGYSTSAGRYGSIFVPASLYNSFLTTVYWSNISSRIVSV